MQIPPSDLGAIVFAVSLVALGAYFLASRGKPTARTIPEGKTEFTMSEVASFNGKGTLEEPILTVIDGLVYNLAKGREFYGEGGPYHPFAGRDSSRLLAKNQVSDKSDTGAPLTPAELEQLEKWKEFFQGKYGSIGKLV